MSCALGRFPFLRASVITNSLHNLCLHGLRPALYFAGGNRWRPCPLFVRALYRAWLPRTSHTPVAGALATSQRYALWKVLRLSKCVEIQNTNEQSLAAA